MPRIVKPCVTEEINDFLHQCKIRGFSPRTIENYFTNLELFERYVLNDLGKNVLDVTTQETEDYLLKIKPNIGDHTFYHRFNNISRFFRYLQNEGLILNDPTANIIGIKTPSDVPRNVPNEGEVKEFLAAPRLHTVYGMRDRAIFEVIYSCALRNHEVRGLRLDDLSQLPKRVIIVRTGKGGKQRLVPIGKKAKEALEAYLNLVRPMLAKKPEVTHVFLSDHGNPMSQCLLWHTMNRYKKQNPDNKTRNPHILRHACALHMLRRGASIRHIQDLLGHEWLQTTQIYTQLDVTDIKKAVKKFHPRDGQPTASSLPPIQAKIVGDEKGRAHE